MASERQIAANQRNARKSTGPRSRGGKQRARRNAYRHGLSQGASSSLVFADQLAKLTRQIAGGSKDPTALDRARAVAEAELDVIRVRRAKIGLIERVRAFGHFDRPPDHATQFLLGLSARERRRALRDGVMPEPIDHSATMPAQDPERTTEAIRRALPELLKLDRYERRAYARRDRAIRDLLKILANRTQFFLVKTRA